MRQQIREEYYILLTPTMALMFYNFNSREEQSKGNVNRSKKMRPDIYPASSEGFHPDIEEKWGSERHALPLVFLHNGNSWHRVWQNRKARRHW